MAINQNMVRTQSVDVVGNVIKGVYFDDMAPNVVWIVNKLSSTLYVSTSDNVSSTNYEYAIVSKYPGVYVIPEGTRQIFLYSTSSGTISVKSYITDEIYPSDLTKTMQASIIEIDASFSVSDGADEAQGAKTDSAVVNPASSASVIALLKGLMTYMIADKPTSCTNDSETLTSADTWYTVTVPAHTKKIVMSVRDGADTDTYKITFDATHAEYYKYQQNVEYETPISDINLGTGHYLHVSSSKAGVVLQIEFWV
jgi:hypothetical protein